MSTSASVGGRCHWRCSPRTGREDEPCFVDIYRVVGCVDAGFEPRIEFAERSAQPVEPLRYVDVDRPRTLVPAGCDSDGRGWPAQQASRLLQIRIATWTVRNVLRRLATPEGRLKPAVRGLEAGV